MPTQPNIPVPQPDETLERYTVRCASLAGDMDPDDFNEAVWETWHRYRGPTDEEEVARRKFSPDKYQTVPGVCVFAEHKTTTADGSKRNYKLRDLARIVRGNNDRISDVGAFPALSDGHTSNPGDPNQREPRILGYAGNYRLGRIGRRRPRWAIFQDEYHLKSAAAALNDKPRRSVELWTFSDGRAHFDPVAAIGAEAPRLPLPQRFSTLTFEDATCERYTFQAGAMGSPGMGSTHVPTAGSKRKQLTTYSAGPVPAQPVSGEEDMPRLNPEDIQQIVAAIAETEQWKWLTEKMSSEQLDTEPGGDGLDADFSAEDDLEEPDDFSDLDDLAGPDEGGDELPMPDEGDAMPDEGVDALPEEPEPDLEPKPEEKNTMYQATKDPKAKVSKPSANTAIVERYTALKASQDNLMKEHSAVVDRLAVLERDKSDLLRQRRLDGLAQQYPGFVDVEDESKAVLYSLGASMTDEQFDKHVATVEKYAQRAQKASVYIPEGDAPRFEPEAPSPEKYAQAQRVLAMVKKLQGEKGNEGLNYDELKAKAIERLSK